jgi:hypothetical protein
MLSKRSNVKSKKEKSLALAKKLEKLQLTLLTSLFMLIVSSGLKLARTIHYDVMLTDPPYGMNSQLSATVAGKLVNSVHEL